MTQSMYRSYSLVPPRKGQFTFQLWVFWDGFGYLVPQCPSNIAALWDPCSCGEDQVEPLAVALLHSKGCVWKTAGANPRSSGLWDAGGAAHHCPAGC